MCQNIGSDSTLDHVSKSKFMTAFGQSDFVFSRSSLMVLPVAVCAFAICSLACVSSSMAQLDSEAQFRSPQIPDAPSILESNGERQTEEFPAEEFPAEQVPVEQYPPVVPFPRDSNSAVQRGNGNVPLTGPSPSQPDSFVPRESTPSGFVPVRPQTELTLDAEDLVGEFQLDVPSRNKEEEKILSLLRSEEVDKAFEATRNREGSELINSFIRTARSRSNVTSPKTKEATTTTTARGNCSTDADRCWPRANSKKVS